MHEKNIKKYGFSETEKKRYMKRKNGEKNMFISMVFLIIGFFFSWTPYALYAIYCMIAVNPQLNSNSTFPSLFAKSTLVWTPIFIIFRNRNFARSLTTNIPTSFSRKNQRKLVFLISKNFNEFIILKVQIIQLL